MNRLFAEFARTSVVFDRFLNENRFQESDGNEENRHLIVD